jgi:hypothetical protein
MYEGMYEHDTSKHFICIIKSASSKKKQMLCDALLAKEEGLHLCIVFSAFEGAT